MHARQRLHRLDRLRRLVESFLDRAHLVVNVADAVERDANADQDAVLGAELDDAREHRDGALRRQARGVDADLPHARQMPMEHLHHLRQIVARRRLAAEIFRFSTAPQNGLFMTGSSWSSVMSDLRSPHFQLLHIVQRASQTQVQL